MIEEYRLFILKEKLIYMNWCCLQDKGKIYLGKLWMPKS